MHYVPILNRIVYLAQKYANKGHATLNQFIVKRSVNKIQTSILAPYISFQNQHPLCHSTSLLQQTMGRFSVQVLLNLTFPIQRVHNYTIKMLKCKLDIIRKIISQCLFQDSKIQIWFNYGYSPFCEKIKRASTK